MVHAEGMAVVGAAADALVSAVDGLQHLAGARGSAPKDAWNHTCLQLLGLLNDYPGGISTPVLETHLWAHRQQASTVGLMAVRWLHAGSAVAFSLSHYHVVVS